MISETVSAPVDGSTIAGELTITPQVRGMVLFAHGNGSWRYSPRNRTVNSALQGAGPGTSLLGLPTQQEEWLDRVPAHRVDTGLLERRLMAAVDWLGQRPPTAEVPIGLFGASTGAAATLMAAAERPGRAQSVASRGGRPDLVGDALGWAQALVLLVVGGDDRGVLRTNREAAELLSVPHRAYVPLEAARLFQGVLQDALETTCEWFLHPGSYGCEEERQ